MQLSLMRMVLFTINDARSLWVTLLKLTFLSQIVMLSYTTKNFCSDTMHTLMLKFIVNPCLSSIFLSMLAKELIDAEWL
jgi:hypothetical protein